jgi:hypothetical protein
MTRTQTTTTTAPAVLLAAPQVDLAEYHPHTTSETNRGKGFPTLTKATSNVKQYTWEEVAQHNTGQ